MGTVVWKSQLCPSAFRNLLLPTGVFLLYIAIGNWKIYSKGAAVMFRRPAFCRPQRIEMTKDQVLALKGRRWEITCLAGLVWITDGVGGDRVIQSGQRATLGSKSKICVQAFTPSVVRIRPSAPAASALIRNQNSNFEMRSTQPSAEAL
jgi:hypothetical protein